MEVKGQDRSKVRGLESWSGQLAGRDGVSSVVGGVVAFLSVTNVHHSFSFVVLRLTFYPQTLTRPISRISERARSHQDLSDKRVKETTTFNNRSDIFGKHINTTIHLALYVLSNGEHTLV